MGRLVELQANSSMKRTATELFNSLRRRRMKLDETWRLLERAESQYQADLRTLYALVEGGSIIESM